MRGSIRQLGWCLLLTMLAQCRPLDSSRANILRIGTQADAVALGFPPMIRRVNSSRLLNTCLETLIRFDERGLPTPWLATSWAWGDEGTSVRLSIREAVRFHDGTELDASAVKWNLDQYRDSGRAELSAVERVDVAGSHELELVLSEPDNTILGNLAGAAGTIISPTSFLRNGQSWAERNPVGTGPFRFQLWDRDVRQIYSRFDDYWQEGKPHLDGIEWVIISNPMTLVAAFRNGDVDAMVELSPRDAYEMAEDPEYVISHARLGVGGFGIAFDSANPDSPFADVRVRRAAIHAVDTHTIVDKLTYGLFDVTNQLVGPDHWAFEPATRGFPYDAERARFLLEQAGYPNGFRTKLTTWNQPALTVDAFTAVQGYLQEVGIVADIELVDTGRLNKIVIGGGWQGLMWCAPGAPNPDATRAFSTDLSARSPLWSRIEHPADYEALLTQALRAPDLATKQRLTRRLSRLSVDEHAMVLYLWSRVDMAVRHRYVRDDGLYVLNRTQWTPADARLDFSGVEN